MRSLRTSVAGCAGSCQQDLREHGSGKAHFHYPELSYKCLKIELSTSLMQFKMNLALLGPNEPLVNSLGYVIL